MSGYNSQREVREVIKDTLRSEGKDPTNYNIAAIMRAAFYHRGYGYGYGALGVNEWNTAVTAAEKNRKILR